MRYALLAVIIWGSLAAQSISNLESEPAPYVPDSPKVEAAEWRHFGDAKPQDDKYASAFVTDYTPRAPKVGVETTTNFIAPQPKGDHHILKNIGKGLLIGAAIGGAVVLNSTRCSLYASNYPLLLRNAAYHACLGY